MQRIPDKVKAAIGRDDRLALEKKLDRLNPILQRWSVYFGWLNSAQPAFSEGGSIRHVETSVLPQGNGQDVLRSKSSGFHLRSTNAWARPTSSRAQSGVQKRTSNVTRWRDGEIVERWVASAWLLTEKHFLKVIGHRDFWALAVILGREKNSATSEKVV